MASYLSLTNGSAAKFTVFGTIVFLLFKKFRSHKKNKTIASPLPLLSPPSSSSTLDLLSLPRNLEHHVFPSFHGADVRKSILSHFVKELKSKAIDLFIDNDIERSKSIGPELIEAIRGSRIAIVLLSKNYASSTWCLDELVEIIKCRDVLSQTVMVLFYKVDPTDVKKQTGDFGKVFRKTCKHKTEDHIVRWTHALAEVAKIAGYHSTNWDNEANMIEDIAADVSNKLNLSTPSRDFDDLVGMETHMFNMEPLLQLDVKEARMIGIWGPSGIGKTTIARFLFNRHSKDFPLSVFVENIKARYPIPNSCSDVYSVKLKLQEEFLSKIISQKGFKIPHLGIVEDRLKDKKILVVLDDVDHLIQLQAMAKETWWFGPSSRIIITTQDRRLLQAGGFNHIYKVGLPSSSEAFQIFCTYAFGQKYPKDGFEELAREVTSLVGELPLGLRVMGSYFQGKSNPEDWKKVVPRLKTRLDGDIESILKFSYDALHDEDKNLFLHIACFFYREPISVVEGCLADSLLVSNVGCGLDVLIEKSLIYLDKGRVIGMHSLLFRLGREIVRKQSINEPGKRQFLVDGRDIDEVFSDDKADCSNVIGINSSLLSDNKEDIAFTCEGAFQRFYNLQFIRIQGQDDNLQSLNSISRKIRYLSWDKFPLPCLPSDFQPKFLVSLCMQSSHLEKLWEGIQPLSSLKWMDLSESKGLKELPDLSTATNLEKLNLSCCSSLVELPSIGNASHLKNLVLTYCSSLVKLHSSLGNAIHIESLDFSGCSSLVELPSSVGYLINLKELDLSSCSSLVKLPSSIGNLINLVELILWRCKSVESLEELCVNFSFLNNEDLKPSGTAINEVPSSMMGSRPLLSELELSSCKTQELSPLIGRYSRLRKLELSGMKKLVSLPQLPYSVTDLCAVNCVSLERLDCSFRNPDIRLNFAECFKLNQEARDLLMQTRSDHYVVLPGGEVPACFTYRASGRSVTLKVNHKPLGTSIKFKAYFILAEDDYTSFKYVGLDEVHCSIKYHVGYRFKLQPYQENLYIFESEVKVEEVTSTELCFYFWPPDPDDGFYTTSTWKIKECGVMELLDEVPYSRKETKLLELRDRDED